MDQQLFDTALRGSYNRQRVLALFPALAFPAGTLALLQAQAAKMDEWFFLNIFEPYLEPFCYFGIPALAAIGLVAFVAIVLRDWKRARRRPK